MTSTLDHLERTLADAYRKEIDQEKNVWRSLPFFAATLALQLAAVVPAIGHLPRHGSGAWQDAVWGIVIAGVATLTALGFLAASIYPARFRYIAPEPDILSYAAGLESDEREMRAADVANPIDAAATLKEMLARQYATATHNNRQINQLRALWRSIAGLATLVSVVATLWLVANVTLR